MFHTKSFFFVRLMKKTEAKKNRIQFSGAHPRVSTLIPLLYLYIFTSLLFGVCVVAFSLTKNKLVCCDILWYDAYMLTFILFTFAYSPIEKAPM